MKESWQNLSDLIVNPSATFKRLKLNPKWMLAFFVFCFLGLLLGWTTAPLTHHLLIMRAAQSSIPYKIPSVESVAIIGFIVTILLCILLSSILTIAARIFKIDSTVKFRHVYAGIIHTSLIRAFIFLINVGLFPIFKRIEDIETLADTRMIPGLHLLASSIENMNIFIFLSHFHVLNIWHVFVLTIAVSTFAGVNRIQACFIAICVWLLRVSIETVFASMFLY